MPIRNPDITCRRADAESETAADVVEETDAAEDDVGADWSVADILWTNLPFERTDLSTML